ncbi:helix-turn-helix transcriptional regulator [Amycolatopsis sp. NPDC058986]|uniref:helix-turn-helix transcriptional regulator n=1 Tax=unclassified Amycolatopsis TaxID=2618356 RepID=UPI0036713F9F
MPDSLIPDLVGLPEAAAMLTLSRQAVHKLATSGDLPGQQVSGSGAWVFRRAVIEERAKPMSLERLVPSWLVQGLTSSTAPQRVLAGYGEHAGGEDEARHAWTEILKAAADDEELAFLLGTVLGSLFIRELKLGSFWLELIIPDDAVRRHVTNLVAAVVGAPSAIVKSAVGRTPRSLDQDIRQLGVLPGILREADTRAPEAITRLVMGMPRVLGTRSGRARPAPGEWSGVILTADEIARSSTLEATAALSRAMQMTISTSRTVSSKLADMATSAYGWPLEWLWHHGKQALDEVREIVDQQCAAAQDDLARRRAEHVAVALAGAQLLGGMVGVPIVEAATGAAERVLHGDEMPDHRQAK